tara:strand:+ start:1651 stop:2190 length:540 start_codon:yes stop_codon:yes gene_type:complete
MKYDGNKIYPLSDFLTNCPKKFKNIEIKINCAIKLRGEWEGVTGKDYDAMITDSSYDCIKNILNTAYRWSYYYFTNPQKKYTHFIQWPLQRKAGPGKKSVLKMLEKRAVNLYIYDDIKSEYELDEKFFILEHKSKSRFSDKLGILYLKVGGDSFEDAKENWNLIADIFRKDLKTLNNGK